jgi:hypothetical protein
MKETVLVIIAVISFVIMIMSFFSGGHIMFLGVPVSGLVFALILRAVVRELEK